MDEGQVRLSLLVWALGSLSQKPQLSCLCASILRDGEATCTYPTPCVHVTLHM